MHSGYFNTIEQLVGRFDIQIRYLGPTARSVISTDIRTPILPSTKEKILTYLGLFVFLIHSLFWKFLKNSLVGRYLYGISFAKYLKRVGLIKLSRSLIFGPGGVAQGYGFLKDVSAYRLFRWFRPSIFLTPIRNKKYRGTGIIVEGYGTLFQRVYDSLPRQKKDLVRAVIPAENAQVKVVEMNGEEDLFDAVIVACPLTQVQTPVSDLLPERKLQSTALFSFLWTSNTAPYFEDRMYLLDYINEDKEDVISTYRIWGETNTGKYLYWGVGYASGKFDKENLQQKIQDQVINELQLEVDSCEFFEIFDYNLRFSISAIREGLHLKIRKAQGKNNIWYSGGMLSHWDVDSIYEFDRNLVQKLVFQNNRSIGNFFKFSFSRIRSFFTNI